MFIEKYKTQPIPEWIKKFDFDPLWEDSKELNSVAQIANIKRNWLDPSWNMKNIPDAIKSIKICGSENPGFGNYLGIVPDEELNKLYNSTNTKSKI